MYTYGGGVNVPLIISWPSGIKARGEIRHQYHHITDISPTVLEVLEKEPPEVLAGVPQMSVDGISMAYTLEDASKVSKRTTQFYRMGDDRGIYCDGWSAAANHKRGTPLASDHWSLYDLKTDFTQSKDLSASHPDKLKQLKALWQSEAERSGAARMFETVTSEDDQSDESVIDRPTGAVVSNIRTHFTLYPGSSHLLEKSTPKVMNRSFSITVPVSGVSKATEGVLVAHGNCHSGYVMYVKDRKLVVEYNFLASVKSFGKLYKLVSKQDVPVDKSTLGFRFTKSGHGQGTGELLIDGEVVSEAEMPQTLTNRISHEGVDVGQDRFSRVGQGYEAPFPFSARIKHVKYQIQAN